MENITLDELTIRVESGPDWMSAIWTGKSNNRDPGKILAPFFQKLMERAEARHHRLELHFEKLEHFNSSTIAALVQFIHGERDRGIPVTLTYDATLRWQALSFDALRRALKIFENAKTAPILFSPSVRS